MYISIISNDMRLMYIIEVLIDMVKAAVASFRSLCTYLLLAMTATRLMYIIEVLIDMVKALLESVLGYNFEHDKQLAFGWLFIIAFTPY